MAKIPDSVGLGGFIAPNDSADTYATHKEEYGQGGLRSVADLTARDAIPAARRKEGMEVKVLADGKKYELKSGIANSNWQEVVTSGVDATAVNTLITNNTTVTAKADVTALNTQKARIDTLITTAPTSFYEQCQSTDTGALEVVADATETPTATQIKLASVTPSATGYTPTVGNYVRLVHGVAQGTAELSDIRVGEIIKKTFTTAGEALRKQSRFLKNTIDDQAKFLFEKGSYVPETSMLDNYRMTGSGGVVNDALFRLVKYAVTAGERYYLDLPDSGYGTWEFHSDTTANANSLVGEANAGSYDGTVFVPTGAVHLILTVLKTDTAKHLFTCNTIADKISEAQATVNAISIKHVNRFDKSRATLNKTPGNTVGISDMYHFTASADKIMTQPIACEYNDIIRANIKYMQVFQYTGTGAFIKVVYIGRVSEYLIDDEAVKYIIVVCTLGSNPTATVDNLMVTVNDSDLTYQSYENVSIVTINNPTSVTNYENDMTITESCWVDHWKSADEPGAIRVSTGGRNAAITQFVRARKGDTIAVQAPTVFTLLLFREPDLNTLYYISYKEGIFYSTYTFEADCYFQANFTNQTDLQAVTLTADVVYTTNTIPQYVSIKNEGRRDYYTLYVAASDSDLSEKLGADYVCDGTNDEVEIQEAIFELEKRGGGTVKLSNVGTYNIESLYDSGDATVGKFAVYMHTSMYTPFTINIVGGNFPTILQPLRWGRCARLEMSQTLYDSLATDEKVSVIGVLPRIKTNGTVERAMVGSTLGVKNVAINIPANKKAIIGFNGEYAYNMQVDALHCGLLPGNGTWTDPIETNKVINGNTECIGLRTLYGYNIGAGYRIDNVNVRGWGTSFDVSGEHLIMQDCCARFAVNGFRFGYFGDDTMMAHPLTLINCCEEWCLNGIRLYGGSRHPTLNLIDYNMEEIGGIWARQVAAKEEIPGNWYGRITYVNTRADYTNAPGWKFWENDGSGVNFITENLMDKRSGTTAERPTAPQLHQQYYDTTISKMIWYEGGSWKDAMGTVC